MLPFRRIKLFIIISFVCFSFRFPLAFFRCLVQLLAYVFLSLFIVFVLLYFCLPFWWIKMNIKLSIKPINARNPRIRCIIFYLDRHLFSASSTHYIAHAHSVDRGTDWLNQFCTLATCNYCALVRVRSIVMSTSVCVCICVCVSEIISRSTRAICTNLCACFLWPWLGPPTASLRYVMYFRVGGRAADTGRRASTVTSR